MKKTEKITDEHLLIAHQRGAEDALALLMEMLAEEHFPKVLLKEEAIRLVAACRCEIRRQHSFDKNGVCPCGSTRILQ